MFINRGGGGGGGEAHCSRSKRFSDEWARKETVRSGSQSMLPALRVVSGSTSSLIGLFFSKPLAAPPAFFLRAKLPGRF